MDNQERIVKDEIREAIWRGICLGTNIQVRENPYSLAELLEQNQFFLNVESDAIYTKIKKYLKD